MRSVSDDKLGLERCYGDVLDAGTRRDVQFDDRVGKCMKRDAGIQDHDVECRLFYV